MHFVAFIYQNTTITEASFLYHVLGYRICNYNYVTVLCFLKLFNLLGSGFLIFKIVGKHVGHTRPQPVFLISFISTQQLSFVYVLSMAAFTLQWQSSVVVTDSMAHKV